MLYFISKHLFKIIHSILGSHLRVHACLWDSYGLHLFRPSPTSGKYFFHKKSCPSFQSSKLPLSITCFYLWYYENIKCLWCRKAFFGCFCYWYCLNLNQCLYHVIFSSFWRVLIASGGIWKLLGSFDSFLRIYFVDMMSFLFNKTDKF